MHFRPGRSKKDFVHSWTSRLLQKSYKLHAETSRANPYKQIFRNDKRRVVEIRLGDKKTSIRNRSNFLFLQR